MSLPYSEIEAVGRLRSRLLGLVLAVLSLVRTTSAASFPAKSPAPIPLGSSHGQLSATQEKGLTFSPTHLGLSPSLSPTCFFPTTSVKPNSAHFSILISNVSFQDRPSMICFPALPQGDDTSLHIASAFYSHLYDNITLTHHM